MTEPYKVTPVFDEYSLPAGLRREHRTKPGVWGIIRLLKGKVRLARPSGISILSAEHPGMIEPEQPHWVELLGPIQMQVEFYDQEPEIRRS